VCPREAARRIEAQRRATEKTIALRRGRLSFPFAEGCSWLMLAERPARAARLWSSAKRWPSNRARGFEVLASGSREGKRSEAYESARREVDRQIGPHKKTEELRGLNPWKARGISSRRALNPLEGTRDPDFAMRV
jgi:hypothetical protein